MIQINKNTSNNIILTLNEELTIPYSGANFLFQFKSHSTNDTITFLSRDISTATTRYNQFLIIETGSTYTNLSSGIINMSPGTFSYKVFANEQPTLNPTGQTVEYGIGQCSGTTVQQSYSFAQGSQTYSNVPY